VSGKHRLELRPLARDGRDAFVAVDAFAARLPQGVELKVPVLFVGRYTGRRSSWASVCRGQVRPAAWMGLSESRL
jgi:hypothetical protein